MHPDKEQYSHDHQVLQPQGCSDDDFFIDVFALSREANDATDEEIQAALDAIDVDGVSENVPPTVSENVPAPAPRCMSGPRPKMSQKAARRSAANDRQIIERIQNFDLPTGDTRAISSVATPNTHPNRHSTPLSLPTWEKTSDHLKLFSATLDIMTTPETAPYAFSFNLTPEAVTKAKSAPAGALDHLKRNLDKTLSRAGLSLPYWFALDIDRKGRLHVHGAFAAYPELVPAIRSAMTKAWGQWEGAGKHLQLVVKPCNEGWAGYAMKKQKQVAKIVGKRTFTIKDRAGAEQTYSIIRSVMADVSQR